jgi:hypothetical protein
MEKQSKQLIVNGKTYILDLVQYPDATWECCISEGGKEVVHRVRKAASEHEVKFLGHVVAYDLENIRRDQECENECESGWKQVPTGA